MNTSNPTDYEIIDFISTIDNTPIKPIIKRNKDEIVVIANINNSKKTDNNHLDRIFRFKNKTCTFEYGCIRLDFSKKWQEYTSCQSFSL